jgi:hypothetical protein
MSKDAAAVIAASTDAKCPLWSAACIELSSSGGKWIFISDIFLIIRSEYAVEMVVWSFRVKKDGIDVRSKKLAALTEIPLHGVYTLPNDLISEALFPDDRI